MSRVRWITLAVGGVNGLFSLVLFFAFSWDHHEWSEMDHFGFGWSEWSSRSKSYKPQDLIEACKQVRKEELKVSEAAIKYRIPKSTIWYGVQHHCLTIMENQEDNPEKDKRAKPRKKTWCMMDKEKGKKDLCCFCGIGDDQELELGKMYALEKISVHYYCLLFSSGLAQNGGDDEGIMGFLPRDIEKEIQRGRKLSCTYCRKKGATIGCSEKKCQRTYHYPCGRKHFAVCRFSNDFRSYCVQHRKFQKGMGIGEEVECPICMEELIADPKTAVWAPCCRRKSWFHKICLQRLALSAGYFFKCPLCNNTDKFLLEMQNVGIFVPEKDASWELEPNAFSELHERPLHCDASRCKCPDGRKTDDEGSRWEILLCNFCGSSGVHIACGGLSFSCTEWTCPVCAEMLAESVKRMQQEVRGRRLRERNNKIEQGLVKGESTSSITTICRSSSQDELCVIKSDSSCEDTIIDVGDLNHMPCKRKLELLGRSKETPPKVCHFDGKSTSRMIDTSDSDDEIDIELEEYQIPLNTVIRELEEHGEELSKQLIAIKNHALRAKERMLELCLTEAEVVEMAKESSQFKAFSLNISDLTSFYNYNLPVERMLQIQKMINAVFTLWRSVAKDQSSSARKQKKAKAAPRDKKRRRKSVTGTLNINTSLTKEEYPSLRDSWSMSNEHPLNKELASALECDVFQEIMEDVKMEGNCPLKSVSTFSESVSSMYVSSVSDLTSAQPFEKQIEMLKDSDSYHDSFPLVLNSPMSDKFSSLLAQGSLTSDEIVGNQAAMDNENTVGNQKEDTEEVKQETQVSGACRKLLQISASYTEKTSDDYDDPTPLDLSDRYESVLKPLVTNTIVSELNKDAEKKAKSKKILRQVLNTENLVKDPSKIELELGSANESNLLKGSEKPLQLLIQPFGFKISSNSQVLKKKRKKSRSHDKNRYVQKTLSPFLIKQNDSA